MSDRGWLAGYNKLAGPVFCNFLGFSQRLLVWIARCGVPNRFCWSRFRFGFWSSGLDRLFRFPKIFGETVRGSTSRRRLGEVEPIQTLEPPAQSADVVLSLFLSVCPSVCLFL